jgi:hypothetical protein
MMAAYKEIELIAKVAVTEMRAPQRAQEMDEEGNDGKYGGKE